MMMVMVLLARGLGEIPGKVSGDHLLGGTSGTSCSRGIAEDIERVGLLVKC